MNNLFRICTFTLLLLHSQFVMDICSVNRVKCSVNQALERKEKSGLFEATVRHGCIQCVTIRAHLESFQSCLISPSLLCVSLRKHSYHCASGPAGDLDCDGGSRCLHLQKEAKVSH